MHPPSLRTKEAPLSQGSFFLPLQLYECQQKADHLGLHIYGAPAVQVSLPYGPAKRVLSPALCICRHYVHVAEKDDGFPPLFSFDLCKNIGTFRCRRVDVRLDAFLIQKGLEVVCRNLFVTGRIRGIEFYEASPGLIIA